MSAPGALDVVTVGEPMGLFIATQLGALSGVSNFDRATAGAELNVAVGLSRLGLRVGYVSRVGSDSIGEHLLAFLDREGVDHTHVTVDDTHPTGFMLKSRELDGRDPTIEYHRGGSAASYMGRNDNPSDYCVQSRHLHLTGISPALSESMRALVFEMASQARQDGRSISFDPNLRLRLWADTQCMIDTINQLALYADLVMPGLGEGQLLTGRQSAEGIADFYLDRGVRRVVIKLGAEGAYFADAHRAGTVPSFFVPNVVDTVGAGDGFAVGVISALLEGLSLREATTRGSAIGAHVVQSSGDCDGLPNRNELGKLGFAKVARR